MSVETARLMAHLVVGGTVIIVLGFIGATLVALFRSAFSVSQKSSQPKKVAEGFSFKIQGKEDILTPKKQKLFSLRCLRKAKKQPMAVRKDDPSLDWSPVLSLEEEKNLFVPTFQRLKRLAQGLPASTEPQSVNQEHLAATAQSVQESGDGDLFEKKDIFQLDPALAPN